MSFFQKEQRNQQHDRIQINYAACLFCQKMIYAEFCNSKRKSAPNKSDKHCFARKHEWKR